MADDLKQLYDDTDTALPIGGGVASVKVANHNPHTKRIIETTGRYTGFPFVAKRSPTGGVIPLGYMFWNGNAMNKITEFQISFAKATADLNPFIHILSMASENDIIHFKDFKGRSTTLIFIGYEILQDTGGQDYYEVTVRGIADNTNYAYQVADEFPAMIEFVTAARPIISAGKFKFKAKGWADDGSPNTESYEQRGDFFEGSPALGRYYGTLVWLGNDLEDPEDYIGGNYMEYTQA